MGLGFTNGRIRDSIRDFGVIIICMGKESFIGRMEGGLLECIIKIKNMGKGSLSGLMEGS